MPPVIRISTKCPGCGASRSWEVPTSSTEIRQHTCRRGQRWVVKIKPSVPIEVQGLPASATIVEWNPVQ